MPGFSGFVAEFPIFMGAWQAAPWVAIVAVLGVIITAAYIFRVIGRVFFGAIPAELETQVGDVTVMDKVAVSMLAAIMVAIGWFPTLMVPMIQSGVNHVMALLGGG